jgi:hypothetical protein
MAADAALVGRMVGTNAGVGKVLCALVVLRLGGAIAAQARSNCGDMDILARLRVQMQTGASPKFRVVADLRYARHYYHLGRTI